MVFLGCKTAETNSKRGALRASKRETVWFYVLNDEPFGHDNIPTNDFDHRQRILFLNVYKTMTSKISPVGVVCWWGLGLSRGDRSVTQYRRYPEYLWGWSYDLFLDKQGSPRY